MSHRLLALGLVVGMLLGSALVSVSQPNISGGGAPGALLSPTCMDATNRDVCLARDAANTLAVRNGNNAQTFRLYSQNDGAGNSEYVVLLKLASGQVRLGGAATGTGSARATSIGFGNPGEGTWSPVGVFDGTGLTLSGALVNAGATLSALGTPIVGTISYCTDCNIATAPCTSGGQGTLAVRVNSGTPAWRCM